MSPRNNPCAPADAVTRRQAIVGIAMTLGSLAAGSRALGETQPATKDTPEPAENQKRTSIHQDVDFKAGPDRIYEALLDSKQFAAFTGRPAEIDPKEGGAFSLFGGLIVGRNIELVPGLRVVQAWRPTHWDSGTYSVARFELKPKGSGTTVVFDHTGFPEGEYDSLLSGWNGHYWGPLAKYLA
ncbi:MAG TPA: SRPBCC family protein [Opitutaceae bacterium]|nr:SRPBCC family protein [Opitutaceae bacterium]